MVQNDPLKTLPTLYATVQAFGLDHSKGELFGHNNLSKHVCHGVMHGFGLNDSNTMGFFNQSRSEIYNNHTKCKLHSISQGFRFKWLEGVEKNL